MFRRGFTLTELLVVIAIILVIVGLAFPALQGLRASGQTAVCQTQIRGILQAAQSYAHDHRGQLIDAGLPHGGLESPDAWIHTLREEYNTELVLRSPVDESPFWGRDTTGDGDPDAGTPLPGTNDRFRRTSYGLNDFLTSYAPDPDREYRRLSAIPNPAATVHIVMMTWGCLDPPEECTHTANQFAGSDHIHPYEWMYSPAAEVVAESYIQTNAHGGPRQSWESRSNYGFVDGSVSTRRFSEVHIDPERNRFDPGIAGRFHLDLSGEAGGGVGQ